ncbi:hypothetical protein E4U09_005588 [Claviceps aff. purpurea]|uniref:Uncharacterized protein n=1 Tax=Claviceps aff. purpurea TaxID=1967640 RepID=A0A9P7QDK1_9HYPO|nr:hypothetical protein E4U09_005588 [Claviceps aff. purpurea]
MLKLAYVRRLSRNTFCVLSSSLNPCAQKIEVSRTLYISWDPQKLACSQSVPLLGDFAQLPPVFDKPLYKQASADRAAKVHAQLMYEKFDRSVFLKQAVRQAGDSQKPFQDPGCATRRQPDASTL